MYTVYQFKEQLSLVLQQIEHFIDSSSTSVEEIIHANTHAYHKAIQDEQNLSFLKKWFTSEPEKLSLFIHNQDTLAQFPSTTVELLKTSEAVKEQVNHLLLHLNKPKVKENHFGAIADQAQELNHLLGSMHSGVQSQHENRGLDAPQKPEKLTLLDSQPTIVQKPIVTTKSPERDLIPRKPVFAEACANHTLFKHPPTNFSRARPLTYLSGAENSGNRLCNQQQLSSVQGLYLSFAVVLPVGILLLCLIYFYHKKSAAKEEPSEALMNMKN